MELIYTNQLEGFEPGKRYRDARLFRGVERDATEVVVVGDFPEIVKAYEDAGVEVEVVAEKIKEQAKTILISGGSSGINIDALRAELESVGLIVESFAGQELARPEGELGPVADRLFQVFEAVNAGVDSLIRERDGEAEKAKVLQHQVDDLLQQIHKAGLDDPDAKEIAELKAKLDEAKVQYRANASKESLEKLVAELPKE